MAATQHPFCFGGCGILWCCWRRGGDATGPPPVCISGMIVHPGWQCSNEGSASTGGKEGKYQVAGLKLSSEMRSREHHSPSWIPQVLLALMGSSTAREGGFQC